VIDVLYVSDLLVAHKEIESFEALLPLVQEIAHSGECFFRMDVTPLPGYPSGLGRPAGSRMQWADPLTPHR